MLRSTGAVLAGYIAIGILVVATDQLVGAINPGEYLSGQTPPTYYFVVSLFTAPIYSILGGYFCAWIAKVRRWKHVIALVLFGEAMGVVSMIVAWGKQPFWYGLALLVLYPPAVLLGGYLRIRKAIEASTSAAV